MSPVLYFFNKKRAKASLFLLGGFFFSTASIAGTVDVELNFDKKPAKFGITYLYDESAPMLSGTVDQKDKKFIDGVVTVSPDSILTFKNSDSVDHNIFANELSDSLSLQFDVGLMPVDSEQELAVDWSNGTLVRIGCKIHPKMKSYVANIKAKEFSVFDFKKTEKLYKVELNSDLESAEVKILLDRYDPISISVKPGESQSIDLVKKGKKKGTAIISHN